MNIEGFECHPINFVDHVDEVALKERCVHILDCKVLCQDYPSETSGIYGKGMISWASITFTSGSGILVGLLACFPL